MAKNTFAEHETQIKESFFEFMQHYIPNIKLELIDEIVLSYVVGILEDARSDTFDVVDFSEIMSAYFPEFELINHKDICDWVVQLDSKLKPKESYPPTKTIDLNEFTGILNEIPQTKPKVRPSNTDLSFNDDKPKRVHHVSETSDSGSTDSSCYDYFSEEMDLLQEMFPEVAALEVKHCFTIANGDVERATQILLHRQEYGLALGTNGSLNLANVQSKTPKVDDKDLKNRIIERYSYVDKDSEVREHKPIVPKDEPKKLVRYRDNKIVSLKGERYCEVKKGEDCADITVKKTKKTAAAAAAAGIIIGGPNNSP